MAMETLTYWLQQALNALQSGSIYAVIALGYSLVYGVLRLINFAHGDVFMAGGFIVWLAAVKLGLPFPAIVVAVVVGTALLGALVERVAYRPLRDAPRVSAVITALGCGLVLEHVVVALNPETQSVPALLPDRTFSVAGLTISTVHVTVIAMAAAMMVSLDWVVRRTRLGIAMRAVSHDLKLPALLGVPVNRVVAATFSLGAGLAGVASLLYTAAYPMVDPYMGVMVGWKAFVAAVLGGIGNLRGAMLGGFVLGAVEVLVAAFMPSTYRDLIAYALLLVLLLIRPWGLLGKPAVRKV